MVKKIVAIIPIKQNSQRVKNKILKNKQYSALRIDAQKTKKVQF